MTVYVITHSQRGEEEASLLGVYATLDLARRVLAATVGDNEYYPYVPGEDEWSDEEDHYTICETELVQA